MARNAKIGNIDMAALLSQLKDTTALARDGDPLAHTCDTEKSNPLKTKQGVVEFTLEQLMIFSRNANISVKAKSSTHSEMLAAYTEIMQMQV